MRTAAAAPKKEILRALRRAFPALGEEGIAYEADLLFGIWPASGWTRAELRSLLVVDGSWRPKDAAAFLDAWGAGP